MAKVLIQVVHWKLVVGDVYVAFRPMVGDRITVKGRRFVVEKVELTAFESRPHPKCDEELDMNPCQVPEYAATVHVGVL